MLMNEYGETPLTVALKHGPMNTLLEATNLLLDHGAKPNPIGQGESPIYAAVSRGHHDVVHLLQEAWCWTQIPGMVLARPYYMRP